MDKIKHFSMAEIDAYLDGELDKKAHNEVKKHLELCLICSRRHELVLGEREAMKAAATVERGDASILDRWREKIEQALLELIPLKPAMQTKTPSKDREFAMGPLNCLFTEDGEMNTAVEFRSDRLELLGKIIRIHIPLSRSFEGRFRVLPPDRVNAVVSITKEERQEVAQALDWSVPGNQPPRIVGVKGIGSRPIGIKLEGKPIIRIEIVDE